MTEKKDDWVQQIIDYARTLTRQEIMNHPSANECEDPEECLICSMRDCPNREPLHYHHDGCPSRCHEEKKPEDDDISGPVSLFN
ncbi:MAG: hypothetical protein KGL39_26805 [Patescibacteria group bacterium]|nr:hypothetical protein [Patescibacteria group bacterium]